jgi:hypothetical protein
MVCDTDREGATRNRQVNQLLTGKGSIVDRTRIARGLDDESLQLAAPYSAQAKEELERRRADRLAEATAQAKGDSGNRGVLRHWRAALEIIVVVLGLWYHLGNRATLLDQITPEIDCFYSYQTATEKTTLVVENTGYVDSRGVWVRETVYVVCDGTVYEGIDVPHLDHFVYHGSRVAMWDLARRERRLLDLAEHQRTAFAQLHEELAAVCVARWTLSFSKTSTTKRYTTTRDFVYDTAERVFRDPDNIVGGGALVDAINQYLYSGERKTIGIHPMTQIFAIDPPAEYLIAQDYEFVPLYPGKTVPLETFKSVLAYYNGPLQVQCSSDTTSGSLRYAWHFDGARWSRSIMQVGPGKFFTKPVLIDPARSYLSHEDSERLAADPSLMPVIAQVETQLNLQGEPDEALEQARRRYQDQVVDNMSP